MSRLRGLSWLWLGISTILVLRLADLQWLRFDYWSDRGERLRAWTETVPARRGRILDRRGRALADNAPWVGERELTPDLQARLAERQDLQGGASLWQAQRVYPAGPACAHVVGFAREAHHGSGDWKGKEGLELVLDRRLRGSDGSRTWLVTAAGKRMRLLDEKPATPGEDVRVSIDLVLQQRARVYLRSVLSQLGAVRPATDQPAGALVVLDPANGQVLAMVSLPDYDPGDFSLPGRSGRAAALLSEPQAPLLNRALAGQYPAASTFKIVTASAALQEGLVPGPRRFYCPGVTLVGGVPFHCFVRRGHGHLSFEESLAYSCDCVYYQLGLELGGDRLRRWAGLWGLGKRTGIQLPGEADGWLPEGELTLGEQANLSIGQGSLLVTPLQMARVVAGVARRGQLPRPTVLLSQHAGPELRVRLTPENWQRLQTGLNGVVERGTAAGLAPAGSQFAGKTGTVENSPSASNPRGYNHTWFVAYGPLQSPRPLALAVFLERSGGYGGALAAPIAARIMADAGRIPLEIEENSKQP